MIDSITLYSPISFEFGGVLAGLQGIAVSLWLLKRRHNKTKLHTKSDLEYIKFKQDLGIN